MHLMGTSLSKEVWLCGQIDLISKIALRSGSVDEGGGMWTSISGSICHVIAAED